MQQLLTFIAKYVELSETEQQEILAVSKLATFEKNDLLLTQGEKCTKLTFLYEGSFRHFYTTDEGEEVNTEFIVNSGFIWDFISYSQLTNSQFSIQALEKSQVIILNFTGTKISESLLPKLRKLQNLYINEFCLPLLYNYQLILSEKPAIRYEVFAKKYPLLIQRISQKHIASYLRLRPETISRIRRRVLDLNQLCS